MVYKTECAVIKISVVTLIFGLCGHIAISQKADYFDVRDSVLILTCGAIDSVTLRNSLINLQSLDTSLFRKNIHQYYQDLGARYWLISGSKNSTFIDQAIDAYEKALIHKPKSSTALSNLTFLSFIRLDCDHGKYYLNLYRKATPKKYWDPELEKLFQTNCVVD